MTNKEIIEQLEKRTFKYETFYDLGFCLEKKYEYENFIYSIIVTNGGVVKIANYTNEENKNVIDLTLNKEFCEDLLFILSNLKQRKE